MKRLPLLSSFILFLLLCMSLAYWGLRFYKPKNREVAAPVSAPTFEPIAGQWGSIFGASQVNGAPSEYQLKGVVMAGRPNESVAIFTTNGSNSKYVAVNHELSPGVSLKEVHANYIVISQGGATKRIDLPQPTSGTSTGGIQVAQSGNNPYNTVPNTPLPQIQAPSPGYIPPPPASGPNGGTPPPQYRTMNPVSQGVPSAPLPGNIPPNGTN